METDAGFNPDGVLTASLVLPRSGYRTAASVRSFHESLLTRAALTGVRAAALMTDLPLERQRALALGRGVNAVSGVARRARICRGYTAILPDAGIRVMSGRAFSDVENVEPRGVVVINEKLARTFWPGQDAIGKRLRWGANVPQNRNPWLTVVGVIADVADGPLGVEPFVHAYEPFSQFPDVLLNNIPNEFGRHVKLAMRTGGDPRALASTVRSAINAIDPQLAIESIATMNDRLGDLVAWAVQCDDAGAFATGSLLLAAIGLYGLLAFSVAERRREIAVRIALGAAPGDRADGRRPGIETRINRLGGGYRGFAPRGAPGCVASLSDREPRRDHVRQRAARADADPRSSARCPPGAPHGLSRSRRCARTRKSSRRCSGPFPFGH